MIIDTYVHIGKMLNFNMFLFGSDNPIDGLDTYTFYKPYFEDIQTKF